jgi:hypothetical protein
MRAISRLYYGFENLVVYGLVLFAIGLVIYLTCLLVAQKRRHRRRHRHRSHRSDRRPYWRTVQSAEEDHHRPEEQKPRQSDPGTESE